MGAFYKNGRCMGYSADTLEFRPLMLFHLDTGRGTNPPKFEATEIPSGAERQESLLLIR